MRELLTIQKDLLEIVLSKIYMKPALHAKLFNGLIPSKDWLEILISRFGSSTSVYCSEFVDIVGEVEHVFRHPLVGAAFPPEPPQCAALIVDVGGGQEVGWHGVDIADVAIHVARVEKKDTNESKRCWG